MQFLLSASGAEFAGQRAQFPDWSTMSFEPQESARQNVFPLCALVNGGHLSHLLRSVERASLSPVHVGVTTKAWHCLLVPSGAEPAGH